MPASCQVTALASPAPSIPPTVSALPPGTYRDEITLADLHAAGLDERDYLAGSWTLTVNGDGTYVDSCQAVAHPGRDCGQIWASTAVPVEAGLLRGTGNTVWFVPDGPTEAKVQGCQLPPSAAPDHCFVGPPYFVDWSLVGTTLTFTNHGGMAPSVDGLSIKPWTKIS